VIELDGSCGEGGGQILRTSLALSLITGTPFRIRNIRANRSKPGLRRQHLTAVRAAAKVGDATVEGNAVNSGELLFQPGKVRGGTYDFDVGTAGSTTLVFQTVLPALLLASSDSTLTLTGGTHNHGGPPWDYLERVFLPAIAAMGARVWVQFERYGFAPGGGGRWTAAIQPSKLRPIELHQRGDMIHRRARALVSNLPVTIAYREIDVVRQRLHWPETAYSAETVDADGPGNILMLKAAFQHVSAMATGFGQRGLPAEEVAQQAVRCWKEFEDSGAPVEEHLADQLLLPLALAGGGSFTTTKPTLHTTTNAETIARFLPVRFTMDPVTARCWRISC
jgi:RNA 3'-terminal phosphate cyclase (ATP)